MLALLLSGIAVADTLPVGAEVERALAVHIPPTGLAHLGDVVEGLVPPSFPISDLSGEFECDEGSGDLLAFGLEATDLELVAQDVELTTNEGRLDLILYLSMSSTYAELTATGDCSILVDLDESCGVEIPTTLIEVSIGIELALGEDAEGNPFFDAIVEDPQMYISPIGNPLSDCTLASAIGTLLGQDDSALSNLILGLIEPELAGLGSELEVTVEDALNGLVLDTSFDLLGSELSMSLYPTLLRLDESGLVLGLGGAAAPESISDCVPDYGGSEFADAPWPDFNDTAWDTSLEYDAGIYLSKDFVDAVAYSAYASGGLCLELQDLEGLELSTELFASVFGPSFEELFYEPQPMMLATRPLAPPAVSFYGDGAPIELDLVDFGLDLVAPIDGHMSRVAQVALEAHIGIDPGVTSDAIAPALLIDPEAMIFTEPFNEMMEPGFSAGLYDFIPTILGQFLPDDLLPAFDIPEIYGVGIQTVFWEPDSTGQWQGGFVLLNLDSVQPLDVPGCEGGEIGCDSLGEGLDIEEILGCGDLGCGADGCDAGCEDSGCTTTGHGFSSAYRNIAPNRLVLIGALLLGVLLRRRRD
jgi:hypothetical protein